MNEEEEKEEEEEMNLDGEWTVFDLRREIDENGEARCVSSHNELREAFDRVRAELEAAKADAKKQAEKHAETLVEYRRLRAMIRDLATWPERRASTLHDAGSWAEAHDKWCAEALHRVEAE